MSYWIESLKYIEIWRYHWELGHCLAHWGTLETPLAAQESLWPSTAQLQIRYEARPDQNSGSRKKVTDMWRRWAWVSSWEDSHEIRANWQSANDPHLRGFRSYEELTVSKPIPRLETVYGIDKTSCHSFRIARIWIGICLQCLPSCLKAAMYHVK